MKNLARLACVGGLVLLVTAFVRQPSPEPYLLLGILAVAIGLALMVLARRRPASSPAGGRGAPDNTSGVQQQ